MFGGDVTFALATWDEDSDISELVTFKGSHATRVSAWHGLLEESLCTEESIPRGKTGKGKGKCYEDKKGQGDIMIPLSPWLKKLRNALILIDLIPPHIDSEMAWKKARGAVISMIENASWMFSHRDYEFSDCIPARGRDDEKVDPQTASFARPRVVSHAVNGRKVSRGRPRKALEERIGEPVLAADLVSDVLEELTSVALSTAGRQRPLAAEETVPGVRRARMALALRTSQPECNPGAVSSLALSQSKCGCGQGGFVRWDYVGGLWDIPAVSGFNGRYRVNFGFPSSATGLLDLAFSHPSILYDI